MKDWKKKIHLTIEECKKDGCCELCGMSFSDVPINLTDGRIIYMCVPCKNTETFHSDGKREHKYL